MKKILFVCLGNICRSPLAEGIFQKKISTLELDSDVLTDSAAIKGYHTGKQPDSRAIRAAEINGYDISKQQARTIEKSDFEKFDLIIGMDQRNIQSLKEMAPIQYHNKIKLLLKDFCPELGTTEVSDPYKGNFKDFLSTLFTLEVACNKLIKSI